MCSNTSFKNHLRWDVAWRVLVLHCLCVMYILHIYGLFSMHLHKRFGDLQMHLSGSHFAQFPSQYGPSDYVQLSRYRCIFSSRKELFTLWYLGFGMQCLHPGNFLRFWLQPKPVAHQSLRSIEWMKLRTIHQPHSLTSFMSAMHITLWSISLSAWLHFSGISPECGNV